MGFSSIKVREEDKERFDRLLYEMALKTGSAPTQHELFHRIMAHALASKTDLFVGERKKRRSWSRYQFELDEETDAARDLDQIVYGL